MMNDRAKDWVDPMRDTKKHQRLLKENAKKKTEKQKSKPLWAMTQQEKESFEEEEADSLINFAEGLDYDKYVGDMEFKEALEALKDRPASWQRSLTPSRMILCATSTQWLATISRSV